MNKQVTSFGKLYPMIENKEAIIAFIFLGACITVILSGLISITFAFKKIEEVERRIATPGKQLDMIRRSFRGGPAGRWMRALHVYHFFAIRHLPHFGSEIASRMGDEFEPVPPHLKLWVMLPGHINLAAGVIAIVAGCLL